MHIVRQNRNMCRISPFSPSCTFGLEDHHDGSMQSLSLKLIYQSRPPGQAHVCIFVSADWYRLEMLRRLLSLSTTTQQMSKMTDAALSFASKHSLTILITAGWLFEARQIRYIARLTADGLEENLAPGGALDKFRTEQQAMLGNYQEGLQAMLGNHQEEQQAMLADYQDVEKDARNSTNVFAPIHEELRAINEQLAIMKVLLEAKMKPN